MSIAQTPIVESTLITKKIVRKRSKGERTREKILLAAIEVLSVNGIKGTTHRAIASQAELQLSLTTYYFKDINELVQQAFQLNSEYIRAKNDTVLEQAFHTLETIDKASLKDPMIKSELCEQLSSMTANYLFTNIQQEAKYLAVEQLMFITVKVSPELRKLAYEHEESQLRPFTELATYFNKSDPNLDAQIMLTLFSQLQYSQLPLMEAERSIEPILEVTTKLLSWIMGLKN